MVADVIGTFFLVLLALLALLLLAPVVLTAEYREGRFRAWVRVLLVRVDLYPLKARKEKKEKPRRKKCKVAEETGGEKVEERKPAKKRSIGEWMELIRRLAGSVTAGMRLLVKMMLVYDIEAVIPVEAEDPADVALGFGRTQAAMGYTRAVLENLLHLRYKRLAVLPDFTGESKNQTIFACKVAASPVIILVVGFVAMAHYLKDSGLLRRMVAVRAAKKRLKRARRQRETARRNTS